MDSAWVGVIGSLGGVFLTSAIGLAGATVNNRWQDRTRNKEREERLHESRASLRRDAYARLLIASDKVEDFLLSQPPGEHGDIDTLEQAAERLRELWARGDGHMVEYGSALTLSRLLAGSEVVTALKAFSEWMDEQFALAVMEAEPLGGAAFDNGDEKRKPLIEAMRSEQEDDLLQDPVESRMGRMAEDGVDRPEHARELAIQRLKMKQDFKGIAAGGAFAVLVCIVVWALGGGGYFWPVWVILGIGIAVVAQGWKAYGPSNRITEADVQREMERG